MKYLVNVILLGAVFALATVTPAARADDPVLGTTISGHGKVLTLTTKATGADGTGYEVIAVYCKQ